MTRLHPDFRTWLVDAHAHLHDRYDPGLALEAAVHNAGPSRVPVLLLVDVAGQSSWSRLAAYPPEGWQTEPLEAGRSLRVSSPAHGLVYLVAGRQIVTREGLEVLALGSIEPLADGGSIEKTIETVRERPAIPVLPWGFGKWIGRRGRVIETLLEDSPPQRFFLGDNGGRAGARRPEMFTLAEGLGFRVLPGSDPLPLRDQEQRVGAHGFELPAGDPERPWESTRGHIDELPSSPPSTGSRVSWPVFARQQLSMLLRKHLLGRLSGGTGPS